MAVLVSSRVITEVSEEPLNIGQVRTGTCLSCRCMCTSQIRWLRRVLGLREAINDQTDTKKLLAGQIYFRTRLLADADA